MVLQLGYHIAKYHSDKISPGCFEYKFYYWKLFSTIVLHTRSYRTWIVQNLIALSSNGAFKRDTSSLRSTSFPCGIMRLTLPAKMRKLPKAGMFRHKRFLLASQCHVSGKTSLRVYALITYICDAICARIPRKQKNLKFRRYSSIDRLDSFGNSQDIDSLYYYLEEYFLVCFEKSLCCTVKHKDIEEKTIGPCMYFSYQYYYLNV